MYEHLKYLLWVTMDISYDNDNNNVPHVRMYFVKIKVHPHDLLKLMVKSCIFFITDKFSGDLFAFNIILTNLFIC